MGSRLIEMDSLKVEYEEAYSSPEGTDAQINHGQMNDTICDNLYENSSADFECKRYSLPTALSQHFSVQSELGDGTISAICHSCGAILKFTLRATSNLITHLKRCDLNRYEIYCQNRKYKRMRRSSPTSFGSILRNGSLDLVESTPELDSVGNSAAMAYLPKKRRISPSTSLVGNGAFERVGSTPELDAIGSSTIVGYASQTQATINNFFASKPIMKHFKIRQLTSYGNITARCLNCSADVKASVKASSNLITHLKRCSTLRFERYCIDRGGKRSSRYGSPSSTDIISTHSLPLNQEFHATHEDSNRAQQICLDNATTYSPEALKVVRPVTHSTIRTSSHPVFGAPQSKQRKMVKSLILSAASDLVPYETILRPKLQEFLSEADNTFTMPDLHTMNDVIVPLCVEKIEEKISSELQHLNRVYLHLNLWTDSNSFSHAHFRVSYISENWDLVYRHLGAFTSHTKLKASSLVSSFEEITEKYKIRAKVKNILTDNTLPFADDTYDFPFVTSQRESSNFCDDDFVNLMSFLPESIGSVRQRLRECVVQSLSSDDLRFSAVTISWKKAVNLITALSASENSSGFLKGRLGIVHSIGCESWVAVLKSILLITENPAFFKTAQGMLEPALNESLSLTIAEMEILKELVEIFNPFVEAMEYLVEGKLCGITLVVKRLIRSLENIERYKLVHCDAVRSHLIHESMKRLEPFLSCDDVTIASFLDPRFKLDSLEDQNAKDAFLQKVERILKQFNATTMKTVYAQSSVNEDEDLVNAAFQCYLEEPLSPMDVDPCLYWKCCPETLLPLAILAREFFPCILILPTADILGDVSARESCYRTFAEAQVRENLFFIDRNKDLFQSSL